MSLVNNIIKMLIGIVILIIGIVWYIPKPYGFNFLDNLLSLLGATIGLVLLFVGLIVAWMGYDDYKMDKEMEKEEKKEEPK
ncbi:Uncharacterised protein [uncultured archaeon]|nr:Uncharacterised protein [uncultured archaeon]